MQTVSKTYGAADAEAQAPAALPCAVNRATVAAICFAAALSGAAVASVVRVRTRAYVADLYGGVSYDMGRPGTTTATPAWLATTNIPREHARLHFRCRVARRATRSRFLPQHLRIASLSRFSAAYM